MNPLTETLVMLLRINKTPLSVLKSMFCIINGKVHMQIKDFSSKIKNCPLYNTPLIWQSAIEDFNLQFFFFGARVRSLLDFRP